VDHQTIQFHYRNYIAAIVTAVGILLMPPVAAAQGPIDASGGTSLYDLIVGAVAPMVDFLDDYAALAAAPSTATEDIWGTQILSSADTGQGPGTGTPPAEYYPGAPEQIRQAGYTLEGLTTADISLMSAFDFAHYLGVALAMPFDFVRGLRVIGDIVGPIGLFLTWLFFATLWVGFIHFLSFVTSFIKSILGLGGRILQIIGMFKP
jgi:hypothetical protein